MPFPAPFDAIASTYDNTFTNSAVGRVQRRLVWLEADRAFSMGQRILEINCGTGIDALHLASRGIKVTACDSAPAMIEVARHRLNTSPFHRMVDLRCLPIEQLAMLEGEGPYDGIFSNFGGLNCLNELNSVVRNMSRLVKRRGRLVLCLFGRICLWEILFYTGRGDFHKAFRRFRRKGTIAVLAPGSEVIVRYPGVRELGRVFSPYFQLRRWRGVGISVPPSKLESFAVSFPGFLKVAARIDSYCGGLPGLRALADHVVLTFKRTDA